MSFVFAFRLNNGIACHVFFSLFSEHASNATMLQITKFLPICFTLYNTYNYYEQVHLFFFTIKIVSACVWILLKSKLLISFM